MVSPTPAKFGGRRHCGGGDVFSLSCNVKRPCDSQVM